MRPPLLFVRRLAHAYDEARHEECLASIAKLEDELQRLDTRITSLSQDP